MVSHIELQKILAGISECYRKLYGNDIARIVLYGSYARHDNDSESDLDVAAIVYGKREDLQKKLYALWDMADDISLKYGIVVSPTVIPYDEFMLYRHDLPYYRAINEEGVEISA